MASLHHQKMKQNGKTLLAPASAQLPYPYQRKPVYFNASTNHEEDPYGSGFQRIPARSIADSRSNDQDSGPPPKRVLSAPARGGDAQSTPFSLLSEDFSLDNSEGGNGLSTAGQAMYLVEISEEASRDPNQIQSPMQPLWQSIGFTGEDYDLEEHAADADVDWVMTKGRRTGSPVDASYDPRRPGSPADMVLRSIEADAIDPFSETYRTNGDMETSRRVKDFNDTGDIAIVDFNQTGDSEDFGGFIKPKLRVDTSEHAGHNASDKGGRKSSPKMYSWAGNYKSPPRSPNNIKGKLSPKRKPVPGSQQQLELEDEKLFKKRQDKEKLLMEKEIKMLLTKSQPYLKVDPSLDGSKKSMKGLTKLEFTNNDLQSPYLEHVKNPKAVNELHRLHQEIFKKKYSKQPAPPMPSSKQTSKANTPKTFAVILDEKGNLAGPARPQQRTLSPIAMARQDETMKFLSISAKVAASKKQLHVMHPERTPDDLYVQTQMYMKQLGPSRSNARMMSKTGHLHPSPSAETTLGPPEETNIMQTAPSSPNLLHKPPSPAFNNIDRLVTEPHLATIIHPQASKSFQLQQANKQESPSKAATPTPFGMSDDQAATISQDSKLEAIEMLANIHIDPLYRIIREEIERISAQQVGAGLPLQDSTTPHTSGPNSPSDPSKHILPANNRIRMKLNPVTNLMVNDIKILSCFQSLPPAIWVTSRIVYFLIMAYFETVVLKVENRDFRHSLNLETMWEILSRHYDEEQLNVHTISRNFSWPYLQELMKHPQLFLRLLDVMENGLNLESGEMWDEFQEKVRNSLQELGSSGNNNGSNWLIADVNDQESSQSLFLEAFPVTAFQPLRDMVKAARGFLLNNAAVLYNANSYGSPLVPGSPLAISASLTAWSKRVIAMLYMAGTYRVKQLKARGVTGGNNAMLQDYVDQPRVISNADTAPVNSAMHIKPAMLLPPGVGFTAFLDSTSYLYNNNSAGPSPVLLDYNLQHLTIPYYLQMSYALIKPSDSLEVLFSDFVERSTIQATGGDSSNVQTLQQSRQHDLEHFLRVTSASPLHRVNSLPASAENMDIAADPTHVLSPLHPLLRHYLVQKYHPISYSQGRRMEQVDMLLTELRGFDNSKPILPMIPMYAKDIMIDRSQFHVESWVNDPYLQVQDSHRGDVSLGEMVRDQLHCSLGLVSDQMTSYSSTAQTQQSSTSTGMRSYRYVVCVQDTTNSWNAFQLACRLAKESDIIQLIHIPTINYHVEYRTMFVDDLSTTSSQFAERREKCLTRPLSSLSMAQYQVLVGEAIERRNKVVSLYKSLGYNVFCDKMPTFVEVANRVLENYSCMLRYSRRIPQTLGSDYQYHPIRSFQHLQYNEEIRHASQRLLQVIRPLQPDFIILGADNQDVYNGLACSHLQVPLGFVPKSATSMTLEEYPYVGKKSQNQSAANSSPFKEHPTRKLSDGMSSRGNSAFDDDQLGIYEEKDVMLGDHRPIGQDADNDDNYTPPDADNYDNESFDNEGSQTNAKVNSHPAGVAQHVPPQYQQPVINPNTFNDYELDSFIVEDNDEGENSLTASPNLRHYPNDTSNASFTISYPNSENNSQAYNHQQRAAAPEVEEDLDSKINHLHQYLAYTKMPTTFAEMMIHETMANNSSLVDGKIPPRLATNTFSFILANIPVRFNHTHTWSMNGSNPALNHGVLCCEH